MDGSDTTRETGGRETGGQGTGAGERARRPGGIVVGYDGSQAGVQALEWAVAEARARDSALTVVHVWELYVGASMAMPTVDLLTAAEGILAEGVEHVRKAAPGLRVDARLERGDAAARLIEVSRDLEAELAVAGSRGRGGFTGLLLGSVGAQLAAHAPCPVVVVRGPAEPRPAAAAGPVVVGVDGSPASVRALALGFTEAAAHGVPLTAVVVWEPLPDLELDLPPLVGSEGLREAAEARLARLMIPGRELHPGVEARGRVLTGRPREVLIDAAAGASLLVVGSRGMGGIRGLLLGSVSNALLHHAPCPVAVVHAPGSTDGTP
ncbi:universal stress protein [Actinomadura viridis]|uniref:Nucleotide-binding universal stress UspA family protein n=1 Tax=Actinomadura viridis TaxID=58110 RepID=A0A931DFL0_9ACTN|nr:universal stress protein [Actinomadura viridis]MBG6089185.1 nucleotide-binding universal stress UspA family protein [Actinomadura viridis]